jgi:pyridoxal phosphate enzyme (YggS family)
MRSSRTEAAARLAAIEGGIADACARAGRARGEVRLVAVSKEQTEAAVAELQALGVREFGENRVQALAGRVATFGGAPLVWHLIGPVQTNKVRDLARLEGALAMVHTIDREALVEAFDARWPASRPLEVCLQVNVDREATKAGCDPDALDVLADRVAASPVLRLRGLMAIPAPGDPTSLRRAFATLRHLSERVRDRVAAPSAGRPLIELSMGMSDDFPLAIAEGATLVRVGSALFGPRPGR